MKLPKLTQEPLQSVDLTPDKELPIRILRTYRDNCDCNWAEDMGGGKVKNPLLILMNKNNKERAVILDRAIEVLGKLE